MARSHQKQLRANNINRAQRQAAANYMDSLESAINVIASTRTDYTLGDVPMGLEHKINEAQRLVECNHTDGEYVRK